jgi:hypothetical protein
LLRRLVAVAYFLEVGLLLVLLPWSVFWERNYFAEASPAIRAAITNDFVRGAVSGLGVVNVCAGLTELVSAVLARRGPFSRFGEEQPAGGP